MPSEALPEIDTRSEEVQEIVNHVPGWLSRWGITAIFVLLVIVLWLSWFIKYPDTLKASVIITTSPPPIILPSRAGGNINLVITENSEVRTGDVIAYVTSSTSLEDVQHLEALISTKESLKTLDDEFRLGELQPFYGAVVNAATELDNYLKLDLYSHQITRLQVQEKSYISLAKSLSAQHRLATRELRLAHERFGRDSILAVQKVLSAQDFEIAETQYLQQIRNHKISEAALINNEIQINQIRKQVNDLVMQKAERGIVLEQNFENARRELRARILKWKETYLFIAPIGGTVGYLDFFETNSYIEQGKPLFAVIPGTNKVIAQAKIPITGSGKINEGQEVNIRLENYPFEQFGMLTGKIVHISEFPVEKNYLAEIALPQNLVTTYDKRLPFKQQLQGDTEIITEDLRVLERLFYQFRALINKH